MFGDKELIEGCLKGDRAYQKALFDGYCRKMMVICSRYTRTIQEAEDVLQEGFLKVFNSLNTFRGDSQLSTWITRIMINTALNAQRQKLYLMPMVEVNDASIIEDEEVSFAELNANDLISMIQSLPDGCRVVFNLFAIEGYKHKEISEILGISEGTSKSQYNRAKSLLQTKLKNIEKKYGTVGKARV